MSKESSVSFAGETRIHIGLRTSDLAKAVSFYSLLLGSSPVKVKDDYAKWEPADPSVNLSITAGRSGDPVGGAHYGIQMKSTDAVQAAKARFEAAGVPFQSEDETVCCYALQDKFWVTDPDGNAWEVFVVLDDADEFREETSTCCQTKDTVEACC